MNIQFRANCSGNYRSCLSASSPSFRTAEQPWMRDTYSRRGSPRSRSQTLHLNHRTHVSITNAQKGLTSSTIQARLPYQVLQLNFLPIFRRATITVFSSLSFYFKYVTLADPINGCYSISWLPNMLDFLPLPLPFFSGRSVEPEAWNSVAKCRL